MDTVQCSLMVGAVQKSMKDGTYGLHGPVGVQQEQKTDVGYEWSQQCSLLKGRSH